MEMLLKSGKFTVDNYLSMPKKYRLEFMEIFDKGKTDVINAIKKGFITLDKILSLSFQEKSDLINLLICRYDSRLAALENRFFTLEQFFACNHRDRVNLSRIIENSSLFSSIGFTFDTFISLNTHTRNNIPVDFYSFVMDKHITLDRYNALSDNDQKWLNITMFSALGSHALYKNYITIEKFLSLSAAIRRDLYNIFYYSEDERCDPQNYADRLDLIFEKKYIIIDEFSSMPAKKRKQLVNLIWESPPVCLAALNNNYLSIKDFLNLSDDNQNRLLKNIEHASSGGWSYDLYHVEIPNIINSYIKPSNESASKNVNSFRP